jgi:formate C-acetyltransferase
MVPKLFNEMRSKLERQYMDVTFDPATGLSKEALVAEFESHCRANPDEPRILTKAWLLNLLCRKARLAPEPGDYFVGKLEHHDLLLQLRDQWWGQEWENEFKNDPPIVAGTFVAQLDCASHVCPDWNNLLKYGPVGLRDRVAKQSGVFYQAAAMVFDGLVTLIKRFNDLQPSSALAAIGDRPPQTFYEALQLAYLYHDLMELDGIAVRSMGRFDLIYNDFYVNDLKAGRLTRDQAKEYLKYFWIKFFAKTQGKLFGKPFLYGPEANELSYLAFEAYHEMRIVDPKFHVRISEKTPKKFLDLIIRCILDGCTSIVFVNNDAQIKMLEQNGKTPEDANNYILIGCYEPAVMGKELNCSGACSPNLAKVVEQILAEGDYSNFEAVMTAYLKKLDSNLTDMMDQVRRWERHWPKINPSPLLSGTMDSCVERGRDISEAGAKYNTSGVCCVGLPNTVDSLVAIKYLVYDKKVCTLGQLKAALAANWKGDEKLRMIAMNRPTKWGNNDDEVDQIAVTITDFLGRRINHEPNARDGVFQAAVYGIITSVKPFGADTGALPDGRLAGEPLTMNTSATSGMDKNGVTSLINSVTKLNLSQFPNGTVLDIMLHPSAVRGREGIETISSIIRTHFAQGGMAIQFNIFDADVLREAKAHPEKYANLQVRVCGWNVRFADLSPDEQDIFIAKAEVA